MLAFGMVHAFPRASCSDITSDVATKTSTGSLIDPADSFVLCSFTIIIIVKLHSKKESAGSINEPAEVNLEHLYSVEISADDSISFRQTVKFAGTCIWFLVTSMHHIVSFAAVIRVVTQRSSLSGEERCGRP